MIYFSYSSIKKTCDIPPYSAVIWYILSLHPTCIDSVVGLNKLSDDEQTEYSNFLSMQNAVKQPTTSTSTTIKYIAKFKIKNLPLSCLCHQALQVHNQPTVHPIYVHCRYWAYLHQMYHTINIFSTFYSCVTHISTPPRFHRILQLHYSSTLRQLYIHTVGIIYMTVELLTWSHLIEIKLY